MEWGIKLKNNKIKKGFSIILIITIAIIICLGIYFFIDFIVNGAFVDWFENNYMITENRFLPEASDEVILHSPMWSKVKPLLLGVFIGSVLICVVIVIVVSHFVAKKREKKIVTDISQKLRTYMNGTADITDIFPREQAEISAQITEIKSKLLHNEQVLKEETTRKNDLIAYLAHDLKTPLTSTIGYLSILDEIDDMPKEQQKKYIGVALDKSYRLEELINELFDIARFNSEEIILEKEELNLNLMIEQIIDDFYPILKELNKNIELKTKDNMKLYADPDKLSRVFGNIVKNAINYSSEESNIIINIEKTDSDIIVEVKNKGKQIPKEKLDRLFEKFYRADSSRTSKTGGSGLGLAIAKDIVELHNGAITAESNENETTFRVELPIK